MLRSSRSRKTKPVIPVQSFSHNTTFGRKTKVDPVSRAWVESTGMFDTISTKVDQHVQEILDYWYEKRSVVYGLKDRDEQHVCTLECAKEGSIECLFPGENVYGCLTSGVYHVCKHNSDCHQTSFANADSIIVCIYSMKETGVVIQTNPYSQSEKGGTGDADDADPGEVFDYGEAPEPDTKPVPVVASKLPAMIESRKRKATPLRDIDHEEDVGGSYDETDDLVDMIENETELSIGDGIISIKVEEEGKGKKGDCNERKSKRRKCFSDANQASLYSDARQIIADLLYNETQRQAINDKIEAEMRRTTKYALRKYYKDCSDARIRPMISQVDRLININRNLKRLLRVLPLDKNKQGMYADLCVSLWNRIIKTPYFEANQSGFHFRHHVLGTLYLMGNVGMKTKDGSSFIIPVDQYLYENLPSQSNLHSIEPSNRSFKHYEKKNITKGRNNIKHSLNSADDSICKTIFMEINDRITRD